MLATSLYRSPGVATPAQVSPTSTSDSSRNSTIATKGSRRRSSRRPQTTLKSATTTTWLLMLASMLTLVPNPIGAQLQQVGAGAASTLQPSFTRSMNLHTVKENTPIGEIIYTLEAIVENLGPQQQQQQPARILYGIEGTQLFSVNKTSGQVRVAQLIDREQTSDEISFQVTATVVLNVSPLGQAPNFQYGPATKLPIAVFILDENDNPPKIEHIRVGRNLYDANYLARSQSSGLSSSGSMPTSTSRGAPHWRSPVVKLSISESTPVNSVVVDLIEALDVDKASSNPLRSICLNCDPEFELRSTSDNLLNDRLNSTIVLVNPLVHVPRDNIKQLHVIVNDGKYNSSILIEVTIEDVQNKPPQFIGSTTCIIHENVPIDKTIMTIQAVDGDFMGEDESSLPKNGAQIGRDIIYDLVYQNDFGSTVNVGENFKLHPLTGQLQVANRIDREAYLSLNGVLSLRVRARELTISAETIVRSDDLYDSILEKAQPYVDPSPDSLNEVDITVIIVDVNDNEPHWLNASEIAELNMNQSPNWFASLPNDLDTGRIYHVKARENSLVGSPITFKNEMFVYDLDNGENANFNISLVDPFNLFDVEPKQVSGFALVTLKLANHNAFQKSRVLDFENPNEKSFIIQLIATETNTRERFSSMAQVQIHVMDANDNAPEFKESAYHANIREDAPVGKMVLLVQATDKDEVSKQLSYSLHGNSAYLFDINRVSGLITVAKCDRQQSSNVRGSQAPYQQQIAAIASKPCIDFEHQRSHNLMVEASDGELTSKVPLTIFIDDASDNPPVFALPVIDVVIEEGAERLDPPIKIEASDADLSSVISYSIVEGNFEGLFSINNATGELQLTRPIRISHDDTLAASIGDDIREQQLSNKMTLVVQATDGIFSTNGTIRIDILDSNDNAPRFLKTQYSAEVHESMSPGQVIVGVRAVDPDRGNNARVSYRIERGSYGQFEIGEQTGVISVSRQVSQFDATKRENYTIEVVAYDHGLVSRSSSVLVHVHVLDSVRRVPEFEPQIQRTTVSEDTKSNTVIYRMLVAEQDASSKLLFEPGPIEALDKNGQLVGSTERLDLMLRVSTDSGEVWINSALDHDFAAHINLTVYVSLASNLTSSMASETADLFNPRSTGYLLINVVDDNSNAPVFAAPWTAQQPEISFQMFEELPVGSVLTQLVASDVDSRISHFKIDPPNEYFELTSPQSGVIVNRKLIDYDALMRQTFRIPGSHRANYSATSHNNIIQFNVYVFDSGLPQLYAKATVSVEIMPINDWDCRFERPVYEARVKENTQPDTVVVQVQAVDLDFGVQHNQTRYQLVGEHKDLFNIDPRTGIVTVSQLGSLNLDRERMGKPTFPLTVIGRDEQHSLQMAGHLQPTRSSKSQPPQPTSRSCSATILVHVDDINDNPPLFSQKVYEVVAYDTDAIDVPLVKLVIRDDDQQGMGRTAPHASNLFRILSGNINESFNITSNGLMYATKPLNETFAAQNGDLIQLRVQVKQQSPSLVLGVPTSFTDECLVRINLVKINRYGPEWRLESLKSVSIEENSKPGTRVTQLKCTDRDYETRSQSRLIDTESENSGQKLGSVPSPIRYWIKDNGSNVIETNEFKLDPVSGNLVTKIKLDREAQEFYQLIVTCEDNGRPQSLESITPLFITVLDVNDNEPEFLVPKTQETSSAIIAKQAKIGASKSRAVISFSIEEHQSKGLPVGELKAIDRDIEGLYPISYCLIEGNEFREFALDRVTGILYTNQTLDREKQSTYDLLVRAVNHESSCEESTQSFEAEHKQPSPTMTNATDASRKKRNLLDFPLSLQDKQRQQADSSSYISVRVDVLDINDNAPIFKRPVYRAGVHHRSLMNTLVTQVAAFDPDSGLNGTLNYRISEILMYKTAPIQQTSSSRKYDVTSEQQQLSKPIKLIQYPFKIDQQGNIYTQQLLTQYQLMSMFELYLEATEQAEPWRTASTKLEIYVYETSSQLKIKINLHPRLVESYKSEIETLFSNATKYTAIINRARSYYGTQDSTLQTSNTNNYNNLVNIQKLRKLASSANTQNGRQQQQSNNHFNSNNPPANSYHDEPNFSNIHLIFVDNFRIVNPNLVMEKFDLTSAQLFAPQLLGQTTSANSNGNLEAQQYQPPVADGHSSLTPPFGQYTSANSEDRQRHLQQSANEVSSLIDKIALASVQAAEYHASPSSLAGIDWLESPSVLFATLAAILTVVGFVVCLIGCCCSSRIKDHIIKVALRKLEAQQQLQAKINERVMASANGDPSAAGINGHPNGQDYLLQQGGLLSSFDATKGCVANNNENMNILQRAMESGEYIDPNYANLNGRLNLGAHYYDASELEQQQQEPGTAGREFNEVGTSKQVGDFTVTTNMTDELDAGDADVDLKSASQQPKLMSNGTNIQRQRQQIPPQ